MKNPTQSPLLKQLTMSLLAIMFAWMCVSAASLSRVETFNSSEFSISTSEVDGVPYSVLQWGDLPAVGNPGSPMLLRRYVSLALPLGVTNVQVGTVSYKIVDEKTVTNPLYPGQEYGPTNRPRPDFVMPNAAEYAGVDYGPREIVSVIGVECFDGINDVVTLAICPVMYSPAKGRVRVLDEISYTINYEQRLSAKTQNDESFVREEDVLILKTLVANPEDVNDSVVRLASHNRNGVIKNVKTQERKLVGDGLPVYEYCIVTSKELAPAFDRMVAIKRLQGFDAGIVCMEDILSDSYLSQGDRKSNIKDDAGCLKQYLKEAWPTTQYALLGGKPPIVPIRYAVGHNYENMDDFKSKMANSGQNWADFYIPTDHYFTEFVNNWNFDGDDLYGEPIGNFGYRTVAYVYVGRLLCTTIEDVNNYIDKLEWYAMNPGNGDISYLSNSYLYFSKECIFNGSLSEEKTVPGAVKAMHPNQTIVYEGAERTLGAKVMNDIKGGKYGFWDLHGHGAPQGINLGPNDWQRRGIMALDAEELYFQPEKGNGLDCLDNFGKPCYTYSMSCTTMPFDSPKYNGYGAYGDDCDVLSKNVGESFTLGKNYGGVAYLGNTRVGYFGYSAYLESRFFSFLDNLSMTGREIGTCESWSKTNTGSPRLSETSVGHLIKLTHNILGDPSLKIWKGEHLDVLRRYDVQRIRNGLIISDVDDGMDYPSSKVVVVEPDGNILIKNMIGYVRFDSVSPCSSISVFGDNILYKPLDFKLQNISVDKSNYVYCSDAELGSHTIPYNDYGNVEFCKGVIYTIDATEDVVLRTGTIVKSGATLKIVTPKNCSLEGIKIEVGGKLIVYAGSVTADSSSQLFPVSGIANFYKYNKYGVLEDGELNVRWVRSVKSKAAENGYRPMLEMGKTWEYSMLDFSVPSEAKPNIWRVLKIDDTKEIGGKDYYVMHCYLNESENPYCGVPVGYFREDLDTRQVFFIKDERYSEDYIFDHPFQHTENWSSEEKELYCFGFPGRFLGDESKDVSEFVAEDGTHAGYVFESGSMMEGFGLVPPSGNGRIHGDLFGMPLSLSGFQPYKTYLCYVKDGDGNVLLKIDENLGLCGSVYCWDGLDSIAVDSREMEVRISGGKIEVAGTGALGRVVLMNAQGMIVYSEDVTGSDVQIPVGGMPHGVYLVQAGDCVYKVAL